MTLPLPSLIETCWLLTTQQKVFWQARLADMSTPQRGRLTEILQKMNKLSAPEQVVSAQAAAQRASLLVQQIQHSLA